MTADKTPQADSADPVLAQRAKATRLAQLGQRIGYSLFGLALIVFFVGLVTTFTTAVSQIVITCIVTGSIVLAPAIVVGYAVKAAARDDLEHGREIG
jgi:tetrahydromethanopterin S-methyltransferase subunit E